MAGLQTRGFSLSTLPQAANFDVSNQINRGNQALSNSILQAGSAIGGMVSENRERDRIAEAEEKEANRLNSINDVVLGIVSDDPERKAEAKMALKSLSPTDQREVLESSMGLEQDRLILGEAFRRSDASQQEQAVENLSRAISYDPESKTYTVNIDPLRFERATPEIQQAAKAKARERELGLAAKELGVMDKSSDNDISKAASMVDFTMTEDGDIEMQALPKQLQDLDEGTRSAAIKLARSNFIGERNNLSLISKRLQDGKPAGDFGFTQNDLDPSIYRDDLTGSLLRMDKGRLIPINMLSATDMQQREMAKLAGKNFLNVEDYENEEELAKAYRQRKSELAKEVAQGTAQGKEANAGSLTPDELASLSVLDNPEVSDLLDTYDLNIMLGQPAKAAKTAAQLRQYLSGDGKKPAKSGKPSGVIEIDLTTK